MEQSPEKGRRRKWPWVILGLAGIYLLWCIAPITWTSTTTEQYPGGVEVRTIALHELCAYIGMADAGQRVIIPLPFHHVIEEHERVILVDGEEWIRSDGVNVARPFVSPGKTYMVLEGAVHTKPLRILDLPSRTILELVVSESNEEFPGHYNVYPFHFLRWVNDESFLVEVAGWSPETDDYRQTWQVDAKTGKRVQVE